MWAFNHPTAASAMGHERNRIICFSSTTMEWDFVQHSTRKWKICYSLLAQGEGEGIVWWASIGSKLEFQLTCVNVDMDYKYQQTQKQNKNVKINSNAMLHRIKWNTKHCTVWRTWVSFNFCKSAMPSADSLNRKWWEDPFIILHCGCYHVKAASKLMKTLKY